MLLTLLTFGIASASGRGKGLGAQAMSILDIGSSDCPRTASAGYDCKSKYVGNTCKWKDGVFSYVYLYCYENVNDPSDMFWIQLEGGECGYPDGKGLAGSGVTWPNESFLHPNCYYQCSGKYYWNTYNCGSSSDAAITDGSSGGSVPSRPSKTDDSEAGVQGGYCPQGFNWPPYSPTYGDSCYRSDSHYLGTTCYYSDAVPQTHALVYYKYWFCIRSPQAGLIDWWMNLQDGQCGWTDGSAYYNNWHVVSMSSFSHPSCYWRCENYTWRTYNC